MEKPAVLGGQALELLPMLDGRHSILDLQTELTRHYGIMITSAQVQRVLNQLDASWLLDSPRYRAELDRLAREFAAADVLTATHAGESYPPDTSTISGWADGLLAGAPPPPEPYGDIAAVVAPHIDPRPGAEAYAAAYAALRGRSFDRVVILGVGHALRKGLVCLTGKETCTPLGTVVNDRELTAELRSAAGGAAAGDDFAFRGEHSVEFAAVLLQHVLGTGTFSCVPVLCGAFEPLLKTHSRAGEIPGLTGFLDVLRRVVADTDRRTLVVAAVDFSHVGPKFGDSLSSRAIAPESEEHDRKLLAALCALDAPGFWAEGRRTAGRFNVCGFGALACLLEILPAGTKGHLAAYGNWHEAPTRSAVSFAAAVFCRPAKEENQP
jgi:AmmeMemoRadiSam system protein B